ncbi:MAG: ATP-binding protein [Coriobacteriia bacterium]
MSVAIREDLSSTLLLIAGESYRVGQIGAFMRIPLGYSSLYGVCTQVGAAANPSRDLADDMVAGNRWLSLVLFGESLGDEFHRGVGQFPTVGDEAHLVTTRDLEIIYRSVRAADSRIVVGNLAASTGIDGTLDLSRLVARHSAVVGSTGSGKSNLVSVLLEAIAQQGYSSARAIVVDPHGEYGSAIGANGYVFKIGATKAEERELLVPYWALPFDELRDLTLGELQPAVEAQIRDEVTARKRDAAKHLASPPPDELITADAPVPFDIRELWFALDDYERRTFLDNVRQNPCDCLVSGSAQGLRVNQYPAPNPGNAAPFRGNPRGISRQLELMRSRLQDARFAFLFSPGEAFTPDPEGRVKEDLDALVSGWVGHDRALSVLDVSGLPSEALSLVVGAVLRVVYDTLFWAGGSSISGRQQPLLVVLEEAHRFLPEGGRGSAHRIVQRIAKEGRKYGVGIMVVSQRPTEVDSSVMSQCGTIISLRLTSAGDRAKVTSAMPDDLGNLASMLPALRTGEGLVVGEAMPIPSRILFRQATNKPVGDDPDIGTAWRQPNRPSADGYKAAMINWRRQRVQEHPIPNGDGGNA